MQNIKKSILLVALAIFLFAIPGWSQEKKAFTLDEAIAYALENNTNIRIELLNVADADGQILEYKSIGIPKVNASVDYNYFLDLPTQILPDFLSPAVYSILFNEDLLEERDIPFAMGQPVQFGTDQNLTANIELRTMLFDGSFFQGLKAQRKYKEFVTKNVDQQNYTVRSEVTKAYLAVLIAVKTRALLALNIRNLEKLLSETRAIYESGFAEQLDVDRLAFSLENLRSQHKSIENLILINRNLLKFQMGYPIREDIVLSEPFDDLVNTAILEGIDIDMALNYNDRPEYRTLKMAEELNRLNQKVIRSGYYPTLNGFASYSQLLQRNNLFDGDEPGWFPSTILGLSLNIPIFDGLEKKAKIQRSEVDIQKIILQQKEFERAMTLEVRNARIQYRNAMDAFELRKKAQDLAEKIYQTTQVKYREGVGSSVELTEAEADLYTAQTNYIRAMYDLVIAKTDLEIALGKL